MQSVTESQAVRRCNTVQRQGWKLHWIRANEQLLLGKQYHKHSCLSIAFLQHCYAQIYKQATSADDEHEADALVI